MQKERKPQSTDEKNDTPQVAKTPNEKINANDTLDSFQKFHTRQVTFTSWAMVLGTLAALFFVVAELGEITRQNNLLQEQNISMNKSIIQTYRPIGMAKSSWKNDTTTMNVRYHVENQKITQLGFNFRLVFRNMGNGLLFYLGALTSLSYTNLSYRELLFTQKNLNHIVTYGNENLIGSVFRPNVEETFPFDFNFQKLTPQNTYFLNVIFFYEDQDGNLYDTDHVSAIHLNADLNSNQNKLFEGSIHMGPGVVAEKYHSYTNEERNQLYSAIKFHDSSFAEILK